MIVLFFFFFLHDFLNLALVSIKCCTGILKRFCLVKSVVLPLVMVI